MNDMWINKYLRIVRMYSPVFVLAGFILGCFAPAATRASASRAAADEQQHGIAIPVLNYHSIGVEPGNTYVLHPDKFARQMDYLASHHYTALTLGDFARIIEKKQPSPERPVLLTFDDGYANNAEVAMPILQRHGFPATLFLSPGFIGQPGYLSWPQVQKLSAAGWDIAPHGMTHPHLPRLSIEQQREEITESRRRIEQALGKSANVFAYPYGEYNEDTLKILQEEAYSYAFTTKEGYASSNQSPYELSRIVVHGEDDFATWVQKLLYSGRRK
ncbi:peptidoglycan/xylan/chitin deacetylase (PgdA/CDA1 family) [Paenibacillus sp. V4I3]|uniref:polysaccharide deacetylase family protein n=1 Tax=unclassified Paenibacillus TaxID=185978 RepID=UPI00278416BD|nr:MULTISPECIES: polysaccharide deacetylase family protein [unclassified Paenibacillus]MDQ0875573.1 peptidoglycan/xylan/chitin deacetylase (PgdA/CDA1 family) [Paenibacillus sp. V4I3]MDQ0888346.1 peptidoglycan/xylan/chitin deacetylase (PgdA/CDA1 family) [Paenibacillus sp. V4I9]